MVCGVFAEQAVTVLAFGSAPKDVASAQSFFRISNARARSTS
jgi:hypothetical protein